MALGPGIPFRPHPSISSLLGHGVLQLLVSSGAILHLQRTPTTVVGNGVAMQRESSKLEHHENVGTSIYWAPAATSPTCYAVEVYVREMTDIILLTAPGQWPSPAETSVSWKMRAKAQQKNDPSSSVIRTPIRTATQVHLCIGAQRCKSTSSVPVPRASNQLSKPAQAYRCKPIRAARKPAPSSLQTTRQHLWMFLVDVFRIESTMVLFLHLSHYSMVSPVCSYTRQIAMKGTRRCMHPR